MISMLYPLLILLNLACISNDSQKITIFAAVSLQGVLEAICTQYSKTHSTEIVTSYASSSTLARQIAQGAPADIYLSANSEWMSFVEEQGAIVLATKQVVASNRLALIMSKDTATSTWPNILSEDKVAVGHPEHVPAGMYASQALKSLELWDSLRPHLLQTSNVRRALRLVEMEEAKYGVVYQSDVQASTKVNKILLFPQDSHAPIEYSLAVTKAGDRAEVHQLFEFITQRNEHTWKSWGFSNLELDHVD